MKLPTLYKLSSKNKISEWTIEADDRSDATGAFYKVTFGYTDGVKQTTIVDVKEGKNIGKANETTPYTQAKLEAQSKWNKQIDKGYKEEMPSVNDTKKIQPMLAYSYKDYPHKIKWPCYWQPKLDGVRCLANYTGELISRQGKEFVSLPHISREVQFLIPEGRNIVLDGELYIHGENFQELIHLIKRDEPHKNSINIEYHIYDLYDIDNPDLIFVERYSILSNLDFDKVSKLKKVEALLLHHKDQLKDAQKLAKENAYEGIMLRNINGVYKLGHRSHDLLKVKEFQDAEFEIVGGYENKGNQSGQCTIICKTSDGTEFGVKPEGTSKQREWYWKNIDKLVGKMLTVRFFSLTTSKHPVPRFPIGVSIRDYE